MSLFRNNILHRPHERVIAGRFYKVIEKCLANECWQILKFKLALVFRKTWVFWIRVSKVPFRIFDKLKNKIQNFLLKFCFCHNIKDKTQIIDFYFDA